MDARTIATFIGLSICGISVYLINRYWRRDEEGDTLIRTSNRASLELLVPNEFVSAIIGKDGRKIKQFENTSGARIKVKATEEKQHICYIKGSPAQCNIAKTLILDFIDDQPQIEEVKLNIPSKKCFYQILGRGADSVQQIQNDTGAKISSKTNGSFDLTVRGTSDQIKMAKFQIERKMEEFEKEEKRLNEILAKREPRGKQSASNNESKNNLANDTERWESFPPYINQDAPESTLEVYVSALESPSKFWIQIVGPKAQQLDRLVDEMTTYYSNEENKITNLHLPATIVKGKIVAAIFTHDNKWYRAQVLTVDELKKEARVFYVDYGDVETVPFENILQLRTDFLSLPFQSIECCMHNIQPINGQWTEEQINQFEDWTHVANWVRLNAKLVSHVQKESGPLGNRKMTSVPSIDLYDSDNQSICDRLVASNLATYIIMPEHN